MKNNKLLVILSIIGIIGIGVIITLLIIMNNDNNDEDIDDNYISQSEEYFVDEVINFGKAAETKYVADSISTPTESEKGVVGTDSQGRETVCYTIKQLKGAYVSKEDDNYEGKIVLTIDGDDISKSVTMTDGYNYYVVYANTKSIKNINVHEYSYSKWSDIDSECK